MNTMDIGLFLLGVLGALLTVYLAKQEVIPEFRVLFDTSDFEKEAGDHQEHIKKTEKDIDEIQSKLKEDSVPSDLSQRLTTVLNSSLSEVQAERIRLQVLQNQIMRSQIYSRSLGFIFYILLGGVFGALLAGKIAIEGMQGDLPVYFQSLVIGATWTTYLSTIGFRTGQTKADKRIETVKKETAEKIEVLKKELTPKIAEKVAGAERAEKTENPMLAGEVEKLISQAIDKTNRAVQRNIDDTKQMMKRDAKALL